MPKSKIAQHSRNQQPSVYLQKQLRELRTEIRQTSTLETGKLVDYIDRLAAILSHWMAQESRKPERMR